MRLTLDSLLVLNAINRNGTFAMAAKELHRVRSAVTYTVNKLENDLGITIFDRSGYKVKLTAEGEILLREGNRLLFQASGIESMFQRIKTGWEDTINIAIDDTISVQKIYPLIKIFYRECRDIRLTLSAEILSGCWLALTSGRAHIAIGATGEVPSAGNIAMKPLGEMKFVFAVAPDHPLATQKEPLDNEEILKHRVVVVSDTGDLNRTTGILSGQDTLTVTSMQAKIDAQITGLGIGYLPKHLIEQEIKTGKLIIKMVEKSKPSGQLSVAWRTDIKGKGTEWLINRIEEKFWENPNFN